MPSFNKNPKRQFLVAEGENVTLEWRYTFSEDETFRRVAFEKGRLQIVGKLSSDSAPKIRKSYRGRLHANMTDDYTSVTLLRVSKLDKGSYTLVVVTDPDVDTAASTVEISVLCKYK